MRDVETQSEWSHILGEAKGGRLKGTQLEQIPSVMTDWKTWKEQHPKGTVALMSRTAQEFSREMLHHPEPFVLGIVWKGTPYAWKFQSLAKTPVWQTKVGDTPAVLFFDKESGTARLYERRTTRGKKDPLTFTRKGGRIIDIRTSSAWDVATGRAVAGPSEGATLMPLPAIVSFRHTWENFHPETKWDEK